jgi:hypothetical protein
MPEEAGRSAPIARAACGGVHDPDIGETLKTPDPWRE